jgi:poly-gamma-glutamate capsule biosynthesis protein CapA/YwtB (metallophosphatase superfamily)
MEKTKQQIKTLGSYFLIAFLVFWSIAVFLNKPAPFGLLKSDPVDILFVGDIMLDRAVRSAIAREGLTSLLSGVKSIFENTDLVIGNLEGTITTNLPVAVPNGDVLRFTFDPSVAKTLRDIGFDGMSLANNHSLDFGEFGFDDTKHYLDEAGIFSFGSPYNDRQISHKVHVKGRDICFVGYPSP